MAKVTLMANLYHYGSDALAEVNNHDNMDKNMINQDVQAMPSFEQSSVVNHSETEITSDSNIIPYSYGDSREACGANGFRAVGDCKSQQRRESQISTMSEHEVDEAYWSSH
ncbi:hypothetical protein Tco_0201592 [Tanacetum coccineum]